LDLAAYDLILGLDWFEQHSHMTCDWLSKWIKFDHQGTLVTLQGILRADTNAVPEISRGQLHKLAKGNAIWGLVTALSSIPGGSK
jgi:hypothetical protein